MISDNMEALIQSFTVRGLWGFKNILWNKINPDLNILVGVNGCGKSTLLAIIIDYYTHPEDAVRNYEAVDAEPSVLPEGVKVVLLRPMDALTGELGEYLSLALATGSRFEQVIALLDDLFSTTGKKAEVQDGNLVFHQMRQVLSVDKLSTGEKQLLLVLLKVFLSQGAPAVILLDEPEISLHISWQRRIVDVIRQLNPLCQIFITSHSPSIFSSGWGDKVVYFEDIESDAL